MRYQLRLTDKNNNQRLPAISVKYLAHIEMSRSSMLFSRWNALTTFRRGARAAPIQITPFLFSPAAHGLTAFAAALFGWNRAVQSSAAFGASNSSSLSSQER